MQVVMALLATSIAPAPLLSDPTAGLRLPLLSHAAVSTTADVLPERVPLRQTGDEVPSDLPDATEEEAAVDDSIDPAEEEPLDAELPGELADEELLDAGVSEEEPLDAPLAEDVALDEGEVVDVPVADAAPVAAAPVADSNRTFVLPADFGAGQTIVRNPTSGNTAEVPTDCKVLVESGRAVVGSGCGAGTTDDGPWWLPLVGQSVPAAPASSAKTISSFPFDETSDASPLGESFPFNDESDASATFPFNDGGVVIAGSPPEQANEPPAVISAASDDDDADDPGPTVPAARIAPTSTENERAGGRTDPDRIRRDVADRVPSAGANRDSPVRSAQTARAGKAKLNPCQAARKLQKSAKSQQQLTRAKAKCRQYKKAKKQARTEGQPVLNRRYA